MIFVIILPILVDGQKDVRTLNLKDEFANPSLDLKPRPLFFWNAEYSTISDSFLKTFVPNIKNISNYSGFAILPFAVPTGGKYLNSDYLARYKTAVSLAYKQNMKVMIYDENGYPAGFAGGKWWASQNLSLGAKASASSTHGTGNEAYLANDNDPLNTAWNAGDGTSGNQWLEMDFGTSKTFDKVLIQEANDRITSFMVQHWNGSNWVNDASGTSCGSWKVLTFKAITASKARIYINTASGNVSIREFNILYTVNEKKNNQTLIKLTGTDKTANTASAAIPDNNVKLDFVKCMGAVAKDGNNITIIYDDTDPNLQGNFKYDSIRNKITITNIPDAYINNEIQIYANVTLSFGQNLKSKTISDSYGIGYFYGIQYQNPDTLPATFNSVGWKYGAFPMQNYNAGGPDFLNVEAMTSYINLNQAAYYNYSNLSEYFGNTIDSDFADEFHMNNPSTNSSMWTDSYNTSFKTKYGFSPVKYYPAMYGSIGEDTHYARNLLWEHRAELYARAFVKTLNDWLVSKKADIGLTGHVTLGHARNPSGIYGDPFKIFKSMGMPGLDETSPIFNAERFMKIVSSAATLYEKPMAAVEVFGLEKVTETKMKKSFIHLYSKGINFMIPHAIWYDKNNVCFPTNLSHENTDISMAKLNNYCGRLNSLLKAGRNVVDIGMVYPIESLHASAIINGSAVLDFDNATVISKRLVEHHYMMIGRAMSNDVRYDYTYLNPDIIKEKCSINETDKTFDLNNNVCYQNYKVIIMPACEIIDPDVLAKIKAFYDKGGKVLALDRLPTHSASKEKAKDDSYVRNTIASVFNVAKGTSDIITENVSTNENGGKARSASVRSGAIINSRKLKQILDDLVNVYDVDMPDVTVSGGFLNYRHMVKNQKDIYFIANSSDTNLGNQVIKIRGKFRPELWDPEDGTFATPSYKYAMEYGVWITQVNVSLNANTSVFIMTDKPMPKVD